MPLSLEILESRETPVGLDPPADPVTNPSAGTNTPALPAPAPTQGEQEYFAWLFGSKTPPATPPGK